MSKCLDPSRSRRNASNTSISAVCLCLTFFPSLLSPYPTYPVHMGRPLHRIWFKSPIPLIHPSVYLSLWFALVSRSQVSLINFVASLCGAGGIQAFKTMRTLRALRPLRAMSRMQGMRVCNPPSQQTLSLAIYVCHVGDGRSRTSPTPSLSTARHSTYPSVYVQFRYQFWSNVLRRLIMLTPRIRRENVTVFLGIASKVLSIRTNILWYEYQLVWSL